MQELCEVMPFFPLGRKAKFQKQLHELKILVLSQTTGFAATVTDQIEGPAKALFSFTAKPPAYRRLFSIGQPKSDTTFINQMTLFVGAFSFFWHAIDRYSFRPNNEALRKAILDPIVFALSKGLAEMLRSKGTKTTAEEILLSIQPLSLRYAAAPRLLGTNEKDENCALWLAGRAIVDDTGLPSTEAEKYALALIVVTDLLESLVKLELPKRIKILETLH